MIEHLFLIPVVNFRHRLRKQLPLAEGFSLIPFPARIEKDYRLFGHGYYKRHYGDLLLKEIRPNFLLQYRWKTGRFKSAQELVYKIEDPIITFLIALRIFRPTRAGLRAIFHEPPMADGLPFDLIDYRTGGHTLQGESELIPFREEDLVCAAYFFRKIMSLLENEFAHRRLFNTLRFFDLGYRSANVDSRLIYFSIALEVLFKPLKGKLTRGMCQRIAAFLSDDPGAAHTAKKVFEIFNFKARVIHGDMTYFEISRPQEIQRVREIEELLRKSLQKILKEEDLIKTFSSVRLREAYFEETLGQKAV